MHHRVTKNSDIWVYCVCVFSLGGEEEMEQSKNISIPFKNYKFCKSIILTCTVVVDQTIDKLLLDKDLCNLCLICSVATVNVAYRDVWRAEGKIQDGKCPL